MNNCSLIGTLLDNNIYACKTHLIIHQNIFNETNNSVQIIKHNFSNSSFFSVQKKINKSIFTPSPSSLFSPSPSSSSSSSYNNIPIINKKKSVKNPSTAETSSDLFLDISTDSSIQYPSFESSFLEDTHNETYNYSMKNNSNILRVSNTQNSTNKINITNINEIIIDNKINIIILSCVSGVLFLFLFVLIIVIIIKKRSNKKICPVKKYVEPPKRIKDLESQRTTSTIAIIDSRQNNVGISIEEIPEEIPEEIEYGDDVYVDDFEDE